MLKKYSFSSQYDVLHYRTRIIFKGKNQAFLKIILKKIKNIAFKKNEKYFKYHFSSPVMSRLKNGSISFRFNNDSQMEIQFIKFFTVKSYDIEFFLYPAFFK